MIPLSFSNAVLHLCKSSVIPLGRRMISGLRRTILFLVAFLWPQRVQRIYAQLPPLTIVLKKKNIGIWVKRGLVILAGTLLLFSGYRACRWIIPGTPDVYKIGMDDTWYPLSLFGREYSFTAFSTDLLFAIARNQHIKVEIVRTGPKRLLDLLDDGIVDGALTSLTPEDHNEEKYYFSDPFYRFGAVFVVRKDFDFKSLLTLPKARIAVKKGSAILYRIPLDPSVTILTYDSPLTVLDDLVRGELDGVIMDQLLGYLYFGGLYRDKVKLATLPLTVEGLRLVTLKEMYTEALIEKFNKGLKNLQEDGTYQRLLDQWDLFNPEKLL